MAHTYAGILGPLAMGAFLVRGFVHQQEATGTLLGAWCSLWMFAAVGYVVGWIADRVVDESVNATIKAEIDQEESTRRARGVPPEEQAP